MTKIIYTGTVASRCHWCKDYGKVKFLKVSPKKSKPACLRCYNMMTMKPEIKLDELPKTRWFRWM